MKSPLAILGAALAILAVAALFLPRPAQRAESAAALAEATSTPVVYVPASSAHPMQPGPVAAQQRAVAGTSPTVPAPHSAYATPLPNGSGAGSVSVAGSSASPQAGQTPMSAAGSQIEALSTLGPSQEIPKVVLASPEAPPQILAISLSTPRARGGQVVSGSVETSSNVAAVEAHVAGYAAAMHKDGPGLFSLSYRVPHLPFFLHRTYWIQVVAKNSAGVSVSSAVPITIH